MGKVYIKNVNDGQVYLKLWI